MANTIFYKNYPMVRSGDTIYYGYMGDNYVTMLKILHKTDNLADKIKIYKISTKNSLPVQNAERENLFDAVDLAYAWLKRAAKEGK